MQEQLQLAEEEKTYRKANPPVLPVSLQLENLSVLIVGGDAAGLRCLNLLLHTTPQTAIKLVASSISERIRNLAKKHPAIHLHERLFEAGDLADADLVFIALSATEQSQKIQAAAKQSGKLVYVTHQPELSNFYLSSLTNTAATEAGKTQSGERKWRRVASLFLWAFFFMIVGHVLFSNIPYSDWWVSLKSLPQQFDKTFYWMIAAGFLAQLVDGALGMGYGVTCTTVLLSLGIQLPAISGSIHTAEMFSSGASGYSHYKFANVNKKLFKALLIPGILGAVAGAFLLSKFGDEYARYIRPVLAAYTLLLGIRILLTAFRKQSKSRKVKRVGWLAGAGGFLDSFGGGGWGPLVTSTLIAKGRTPRYVIGSVSITEFFVTLASALTFFSLLGISHWQIILGLIIGGLLAAPIAARLAGKLPLKTMFIGVGSMVIIWSLRIIIKAFF